MDDKFKSARHYVEELNKSGYCPDYNEWIDRGIELASLGENARSLFHTLSNTHHEYDYTKADNKFNNLLSNHKGAKNIESLFHFAHKEMNIPAPTPTNNGSNFSGQYKQQKVNGYNNQEPPLDQDPILEGEKWLLDIDDIMEAPDVEYIYLFIKGSNNALVASSEAGKTTLMTCLAYAIASGWENFLGWDLNALKGSVLFVSTEDGIGSFAGRLRKLKRKYGLPPKGSIRFIFDNYRILEKIESALKERPCDLVIIDTWGDYVGGEYVGDKTRPMMNEIKRICQKYDATPVYVHHTNKASENIPEKSSIKGVGDFEQACRSVIMLNVFQDYRWLSIVKLNEFSDEQKRYSFRLDYDHDSGMVSRGEETMERAEIVRIIRSEMNGTANKKDDVSWDEVLASGEFIKHKDLIDKIMGKYDLSEPTIKRRIKEATEKKQIHKLDDGTYSLTAF